jgi:hypothetical protein
MDGFGLYYIMEGDADITVDFGDKKQKIGKIAVII